MSRTLTLKRSGAFDVARAVEEDRALDERAKVVGPEWEKHISPAGSLGLSALLDERRWKYKIVDEAFHEHATFDRLLIAQIEGRWEEGQLETFAGTSIVRPQTAQTRAVKTSTRGVIITAGLLALDQLRSNGMDVGHIVNFVRLAPWEKQVGSYAGQDVTLIVLRVGDIVSSEDLQEHLRAGKVKVVRGEDGQHYFQDENGKQWKPELPFMDSSY